MATLPELQARLARVEAAIENALENGQAYNVSNSHGVTNVDLSKLQVERALLERKILRASGWTGRNYAQFE